MRFACAMCLAAVSAVGMAETVVKVGVLCEAPFADETFAMMKREGLGTSAPGRLISWRRPPRSAGRTAMSSRWTN